MVNYDKAISDILSLINIVDVISRYINVKKYGNSYKALCPFHDDKKTPSLSISPEKGLYHCFGCGASGNVINFVSEIEGISKGEAIKKLANEIGIDLSSGFKSTEKENMKKIMQLAEIFFHKTLFNEVGKNKLLTNFIKSRNLSEKAARKFKLGYCPYSAKTFLKELSLYNIDPKYAYDLTLIYDDKNSGAPVFRFKYRFIFPIKNIIGETIAFGGRILDDNQFGGKYINSSNSLIYNKSYILFGLNYSKDFIKEKNSAILVEGYFDMLSLHMAGIKNSVASSGTALTDHQVNKLKKFTDHVNILYDSDEAGQNAAFRSIEMFFKNGMEGKVFTLPVKDPDEFMKKYGAREFEEFMGKNGIDLKDFYLEHLKKIYDFSNKKEKENGFTAAMELLRSISDVDIKSQMIKKIAHAFNYELIFVEEAYIKKYSSTKPSNELGTLNKIVKDKNNDYERALENLLKIIFQNIPVFENKLDLIQSSGLMIPSVYRDLLSYLTDYLNIEENNFMPNNFLEYLSDLDIEDQKKDELIKIYGAITFENYTSEPNVENTMERLFYISKIKGIERKIVMLRNKTKQKLENKEKDLVYSEMQDLAILKKKIIKKIGGNFYG